MKPIQNLSALPLPLKAAGITLHAGATRGRRPPPLRVNCVGAGITLLTLLLLLGSPAPLRAQTTAFTYQGQLVENGTPASGQHDFEFRLFDGAGQSAGPVVLREAVEVAGGDFTVALDFGAGVFDGGERWLEIGVRRRGTENFTALSPRQPVLAVPHAIFADTSARVANGSAVRSLNGLRDDLQLAAGANITITPNGNTLTLAATGGGGGGGGGDSFWSHNGVGLSYSGGNVGVGTASPAAALEVSGANGNTLLYATAPRPNLVFRDTAAGGARSTIGGVSGGLSFTTENFQSGVSATAFMTFDRAGRLGLGTASPASALHVSGAEDALRFTGVRPQLTFEDTVGGLFSRIQGDGGGLFLRTQGGVTGSDPSGVLALTGAGKVGIGTAVPASKLEVAGEFDGNFSATLALTGTQPTQLWSQETGLATGQAPGSRHWAGHLAPNGSFGFYHRRLTFDFLGTTDSGWEPRLVSDAATGDLTVTGRDLRLGHPERRGAPGRALVDWNDGAGSRALVVNWAADWPETWIGGTVTQVKTLRITGGADLSEPFAMSQPAVPAGAVVVIDERHPGKLRLSTSAYDKKVAGIVSGANGIQPGISMIQEDTLEAGENVALSGRVYVKANRNSGDIAPGDLLTTSEVSGEAMKAADHQRAQGAILGKAMTGLDPATRMVLVLVTLR